MAEQESKKLETESPVTPTPATAPAEFKQDAAQEKAIVPSPEEKLDESKALAVVDNIALAEVEKEKRNSFIKAWEDSEKTKAENKSLIVENLATMLNTAEQGSEKALCCYCMGEQQKAALEAKLRKIEENLEKQKAEYAEKMKNKVALVHKQAEEKRAMVEAQRGEELLKAEEMAAKYRATGQTPKKLLGCF
ncbi:hypothetical protein GH714_038834 [Hevea brasiliensis]|uniref:Remorin C-terminal domain-containing protein n=1 Tax=Hevea brasiliensis TaxID=3981 RepID=A0A6A6MRY2_HEVBR|nr:hypothetical protein GH714_038834 [Hevea brasiliensis]